MADYVFGSLENHLVQMPTGLFASLALALSVYFEAQVGVI
jgi:hypothetical protein